MRRRAVGFFVAAVLMVAAVALVAVAVTSGESRDPAMPVAAPAVPPVADPAVASLLPPGGRLLVRGVRDAAPRADGQLFEVRADGEVRRVGDLECKRVDAVSTGHGLCLGVDRIGVGYEGVVFDERYRPLRRFEAEGVPDRARVSPDGRYGAYTSFDEAGSFGYFRGTAEFSTYTRIVAMSSGRELLRLEDLDVERAARRVPLGDAELWGVTFVPGSDRYYATLAVDGHHYLIAGTVGSRRARIIHDRVECPALSPDGTRIAYKRRLAGEGNRWRFYVLHLATGRHVALAEPRSIDDQPAWLGNDLVLYSDDKAVFAVPADGSGAPRRLVSNATSPSYLAR